MHGWASGRVRVGVCVCGGGGTHPRFVCLPQPPQQALLLRARVRASLLRGTRRLLQPRVHLRTHHAHVFDPPHTHSHTCTPKCTPPSAPAPRCGGCRLRFGALPHAARADCDAAAAAAAAPGEAMGECITEWAAAAAPGGGGTCSAAAARASASRNLARSAPIAASVIPCTCRYAVIHLPLSASITTTSHTLAHLPQALQPRLRRLRRPQRTHMSAGLTPRRMPAVCAPAAARGERVRAASACLGRRACRREFGAQSVRRCRRLGAHARSVIHRPVHRRELPNTHAHT